MAVGALLIVMFQETDESQAVESGGRRRLDDMHRALLGVLRDQGVGADEGLRPDMHAIGDVAVAAEIGVLPDRHIAVANDVGCEKSMIADPAAVADLAAAPDHHIVADRSVEIDRLFLQDEAVFADLAMPLELSVSVMEAAFSKRSTSSTDCNLSMSLSESSRPTISSSRNTSRTPFSESHPSISASNASPDGTGLAAQNLCYQLARMHGFSRVPQPMGK
jgi:hypothetical protein